MKANELRIGNLILAQYGHGYEDEVIVEKDTFERFNSDHVTFTGIPLTEEWLIKFGFDKLAPIKSEHFHTKRYGKFITLCMTGYWLEFHFPASGYQPVSENEIILKNHLANSIQSKLLWGKIYVHSLQNLYFALTGTELTIIKTVETNKTQSKGKFTQML